MHTGSIEVKKVDDDQYYSKENILWREKCELTSRMNRMKAGHDEFVTNLILEHQKNLGTMKQEFEKKFKMLKNEYNEGIDTLKHDMEEAKKKEIKKIEKSANGRTENLAKYYHEAFIGLKNCYDATNESNLSIIATLKDENMELQIQESFLQMKFNTLSRQHELLKATILKDTDEINYSVQNKMKELSEKVKHLHQENHLLAERLKIIESERDALRSSFVSVIQYVEDRIKTKATHAEQKVQTIKENFRKEPALWDPSLMCPPASRRRHEINEELARILDYIGHLGITARQSGPHAGMSQGTSGTAPTYQ